MLLANSSPCTVTLPVLSMVSAVLPPALKATTVALGKYIPVLLLVPPTMLGAAAVPAGLIVPLLPEIMVVMGYSFAKNPRPYEV